MPSDSGKITPNTDHGDKYRKPETGQGRRMSLQTDQITSGSHLGPGEVGRVGQPLTLQVLSRLAAQVMEGDNTHDSHSASAGKASSLGTNNTDTDAKGSSHSMTPIEPIQGQNMDFMFSHMGAGIGDTAIGELSRRQHGVAPRLGPFLSSDFEWSLFKDHGYVDIDDKVKMIKPPDRNCDRLGYAFFYNKKEGSSYGHLQDLKLAEQKLQREFTLITSQKSYEGNLEKGDLGNLEKGDQVTLEKGDLVIFRHPETKQLSDAGILETFNENTILTISGKFIDEGGIYEYDPKVQLNETHQVSKTGYAEKRRRNPLHSWQVYRRKNKIETKRLLEY